jgi:hypothetical protein
MLSYVHRRKALPGGDNGVLQESRLHSKVRPLYGCLVGPKQCRCLDGTLTLTARHLNANSLKVRGLFRHSSNDGYVIFPSSTM